MELPQEFNWIDYFILNPDVAGWRAFSFNHKCAIRHYLKLGCNQNRNFKLDDSHSFYQMKWVNHMFSNKKIDIKSFKLDDKITLAKEFMLNKNTQPIPFYLIVTDKRDINLDENNKIILKSTLSLEFSDGRSKQLMREDFPLYLKNIRPKLTIFDFSSEWNIDDLNTIIREIDSPYCIIMGKKDNIDIYKDIIKNAKFVVSEEEVVEELIDILFDCLIVKNMPSREYMENYLKSMKFNLSGEKNYITEYVDLLRNYDILSDNDNDNAVKIRLQFPFKNGGFMINTEKLSIPSWRESVQKFSENNIIIDFCKANTNVSGIKSLYLPCLYHEKSKWSHPRTYEYDVGFVGTLSLKRRKILDVLKKRGLSVKEISKFGEERDIEISKCKIIVNIHFNDNHKIFEYFRCSRLVFNKIPIVSEISLDSNELNINEEVLKYVSFAEYDNLVDKCVEILNNYENYTKTLYNNFSYERLKEYSQKSLSDFKNKIIKYTKI